MDETLRQLERKAVAGDERAQQQLDAVRRRVGARITKSGGNVVTDVVGLRVWRSYQGQERDYRRPTIIVVGRVVAAYVPAIAATSVASSNYHGGSSRSSLRFVVQTDEGAFDDMAAAEWKTFDHPQLPESLRQ